MQTGTEAAKGPPPTLTEEQVALWEAQVEAVRREPNEVTLRRALAAVWVIPIPWRYGCIGDLYMARVEDMAPTGGSAALYAALRQFSTRPMSHEVCVAAILNKPGWRRNDHPREPAPASADGGSRDGGQLRRHGDGAESG